MMMQVAQILTIKVRYQWVKFKKCLRILMEIKMKIMMTKAIKASLFRKMKINKRKNRNHQILLVHVATVQKNLINTLIYKEYLKKK
jgi:hypothetical protein